MASERSIKVDPKKIKVTLDMLALKAERDIRSFLGRL